MHEPEAAATAVAQRLLAPGGPVDRWAAGRVRWGPARPVLDPAGRRPTGWFVPAVVDDLLLGYALVEPDGRLRRWSTFQRHPGGLAGCPPAAGWLDPEVVRDMARRAGEPGEPGDPFLSFDGVPDRLAWAVPVGDGLVFVAGTAVWAGG